MRRLVAPFAIACAVALWVSAAPVAAETVAEMQWTALSRYGGDADGDGRIDPPATRRLSSLAVFPVLVHPSAAICAAEEARWFVDGRRRGGIEPSREGGECRAEVTVRGERAHRVEVRVPGRTERAQIEIDDLLIVAIGDSVASGEGNPEDGRPRWLDAPCHRSSAAGVQRAARILAGRRRHRSVTFVSLACSGASIETGLLGDFRGYAPQLTRLAALEKSARGGDGIDAVLVSIGANDVRFSAVVGSCAVWPWCRRRHEKRLDAALTRLEGDYDTLGEELRDAAPGAPVLITEYFDPTRDEKGEFCQHTLGIATRAHLKWAYEGLLVPLNEAIAEAADRNAWTYVGGIAADFRHHGYCAEGTAAWVRRFFASLRGQRDHKGTFHPNADGHEAIAERVASSLESVAGHPQRKGGGKKLATVKVQSGARSIWEVAVDLGAPLGPIGATAILPLLGAAALALALLPLALLVLALGALALAVWRLLLLVRPTWPDDEVPAEKPSLRAGAGPPTLQELLVVGGGLAIAVLVAALFSGLVGRAILWMRFWSANLPADQAVDAVSRGELVATGSQALLVFGALGLVAMAAAWILDGKGRWGRSTRRGLVAIGLVELVVAVLIGDFPLGQGLALFGGLVAAALLLHFLLDRALEPGSPLRSQDPPPIRAVLARIGGWLRGFADGLPENLLLRLWQAFPLLLLLLAVVLSATAEGPDRFLYVLAPYAIAAVAFVAPGGLAAPGVQSRGAPSEPLLAPRIALAVAGIACILILIVRDEAWLAAAAAIATALGFFCLAVAAASGKRFGPYGLAVLVSVPVFGAAAAILHGADSPELQPAAAILKDGRAICGVYVGESDGRLWLGRLELDERADVSKPRRGDVFPIDSERIASQAVGRLEPVARAQRRAVWLRDRLAAEGGGTASAPGTPACAPPEPEAVVAASPGRELAERFQPELVLDREDGFWPIPVTTIFSMQDRRAAICRRVARGRANCLRLGTPGEFPWAGGEGESLEYPAADGSRRAQHALMVDALGSADPDSTATEYFLAARRPGENEPISLQYWFFYSFNYQPIGGRLARAGFHEGDFESIGVLLSARTKRPRYVWMARHDEEGRPFLWEGDAVRKVGSHPLVFVARGSHASYETCGGQRRPVAPQGVIDDQPACEPEAPLHLNPEVTPIVDLARVGWGCWHGLFGHRNGGERAYERIEHLINDAPRSPLWQQEFGGVDAEPCRGVGDPGGRDGRGEEVVEEGDGVPAVLRSRAGSLVTAIDQCSDWWTPPPTGSYMVACNPVALRAYVDSGLEDPGEAGVRIEAGSNAGLPPTQPAARRGPSTPDPSAWRVTAEAPTIGSVFASCPSGHGIVAALFDPVPLRPGRPLRLRDRGPAGAWRLVRPDGRPAAEAFPFPTEEKKGRLVEAPRQAGRVLACR